MSAVLTATPTPNLTQPQLNTVGGYQNITRSEYKRRSVGLTT